MGNRFSSLKKKSSSRGCCCVTEPINDDCDETTQAKMPDEIAPGNENDQRLAAQNFLLLTENTTSYNAQLHDSQNVNLHVVNHIGQIEFPRSENIIIGDGGSINTTREERDEMREASIFVLQRINDNVQSISDNVQNISDNQFSRRHGQEFLQKLEQIMKEDRKERTKSCSTYPQGCRPKVYRHQSSNTNPFSLEDRKFKRLSTSGHLDEEFQHYKWSQHACTQRFFRSILCEVEECENEDGVKQRVATMERAIKDALDQETQKAKSSFLQTGVANGGISSLQRKNSLRLLNENRDNAFYKVESDLKKIQTDRVNRVKISKRPSRKSIGDYNQIKKDAHAAAEKFIKTVTDNIIVYVLRLLVFKVEENIIRVTFNCQKSNVIKAILEELPRKGFVDFMQYILNPNEYGKTWLQNLTNRKLFYEKAGGKHLYSTFADEEIEIIFQSIEKSIDAASVEQKRIDEWVRRFLERMHEEKVLPISAEDLHDVKVIEDVDLPSFLAVLKSRIGFMKDGANKPFIETTERSVTWESEGDPYDKIIESLWGCCECCPFCAEPCKYTDKDHLKQGLDHVCIQHRPLGVYGFLNTKRDTLVFKNCSSLVKISDMGYKFYENESLRPCSEYRKEFPSWKIDSIQHSNAPKYWMWFIKQYKDKIEEFYKAQATPLPNDLDEVNFSDALCSLHIYS